MDAKLAASAARFLRRQSRQLAEQLDGIYQARDPECIHRARVASRRLRASLQIFRAFFAEKQIKRWRKEVRRFARALGPARDRDVQTLQLSQILADVADPERSPGIAALLSQVDDERRAMQDEVRRAVKRLRRSEVVGEMRKCAKRILRKTASVEAALSPAARQAVGQHVSERLSILLAEQDCLARPDDTEGHHAMRIAAKRLRYTAEICNPVFDGRLDGAIDAMKQLQSLLGDIHDCDVWLQQFDDFLHQQRCSLLDVYGAEGPYERLKVGIEFLARQRRERRATLFEQLVELWEELRQQRIWLGLREALETVPPPSVSRVDELMQAAQTSDAPAAVRAPAFHAAVPNGNGGASHPVGNGAGQSPLNKRHPMVTGRLQTAVRRGGVE